MPSSVPKAARVGQGWRILQDPALEWLEQAALEHPATARDKRTAPPSGLCFGGMPIEQLSPDVRISIAYVAAKVFNLQLLAV